MNIDLKEIWFKLCLGFTADEQIVGELWGELERAYTKRNRYYHNLDHLGYMINKAIIYKTEIKNFDILSFSIFYHDVIYDVKRADNEVKSADFAVTRLQSLKVPSADIEMCVKQILATKAHENSGDPDVDYLLDFDLGILGEPWDVYETYMSQIRKEYSLYPGFMYKKGRRAVLAHFLDNDYIYKTAEFRKSHEQQARANLRKELEILS